MNGIALEQITWRRVVAPREVGSMPREVGPLPSSGQGTITDTPPALPAPRIRAQHWDARPVPMFTTGKVGYEIGANIEATCFGGVAAVHRLVSRLGLVEAIDTELELLKVHLPYHESDHVLNGAVALIDRVADATVQRCDRCDQRDSERSSNAARTRW